MKYRKKPVIVEAMQFTGKNHNEIIKFVDNSCRKCLPNRIVISTLEGITSALISDFIIRGVRGEFYSCKLDVFEETYQKVE